MVNIRTWMIRGFTDELRRAYYRNYGNLAPEIADVLVWAGEMAMEKITASDALYHNYEHTIMVTLVGQEILRGKHLQEGGVMPEDWMHMLLALLFHDIGFIRGICRADQPGEYATGVGERTIKIAGGGSDAALTAFHVDRSKLFVKERFSDNQLADIDAERIADYIEMTRMPVPTENFYQDTNNCYGLTRAADYIGQLADPDYLRKIPALFYEFEETGTNLKIGYENPGDMREKYARFFWQSIHPYIKDALKYLAVTTEGKQWVANLHKHVFDIEHAEATV